MSADSHDPLEWIDDVLAELEASGLRRRLVTRVGPQGPSIVVEADRGEPLDAAAKTLINFSANDYLALAADPRLAAAAQHAAAAEGWGAGASPLVTGHSQSHRALEARLAEFLRTDAALVFPSGFAANSGTIAALVGRGDLVLADQKNHASLIDGCRLSRAEVGIYPHRDVRTLAELLDSSSGFRRRLIVTDTLFSMDGDLAPLAELVELAREHRAMLMIDEAHAIGVFGANGRGVAEHLGLEADVPIRVGTLSKALGSAGGFVAGSQRLIDWLTNRARPYVFSTAQSASRRGGGPRRRLRDRAANEPQRRIALLERAAQLRHALIDQGWNIGGAAGQIIPVIVGEAALTIQLASSVRDRGLFVPGIRPPSVPEGESLLRISLSYGHTPEMLERLIDGMAHVKQRSAV